MPILRKAGIIRTRHKNATGADTKLKFGTSKLFGTKNKYKKFQIDWVKGRPILTPGIEGGGGKQPALWSSRMRIPTVVIFTFFVRKYS